jgi:hypothetical protein
MGNPQQEHDRKLKRYYHARDEAACSAKRLEYHFWDVSISRSHLLNPSTSPICHTWRLWSNAWPGYAIIFVPTV